jgi:hypothetical protein
VNVNGVRDPESSQDVFVLKITINKKMKQRDIPVLHIKIAMPDGYFVKRSVDMVCSQRGH